MTAIAYASPSCALIGKIHGLNSFPVRRALHASQVEVAEGRVRLVRASALVYSSRIWVKKPCGFDFMHMKQVGFGIDCPGDEYRLPGKISSFLLIVQ